MIAGIPAPHCSSATDRPAALGRRNTISGGDRAGIHHPEIFIPDLHPFFFSFP
jgi:hypothetical protein